MFLDIDEVYLLLVDGYFPKTIILYMLTLMKGLDFDLLFFFGFP